MFHNFAATQVRYTATYSMLPADLLATWTGLPVGLQVMLRSKRLLLESGTELKHSALAAGQSAALSIVLVLG